MRKRNINLRFKQVTDTHIDIIMCYEEFSGEKGVIWEEKEKKVGHIFSPSGSSNNCLNSIQVCGLSEVFDYWGCGLFGKPIVHEEKIGRIREYSCDENGKPRMEQVKDIQLYFDEDTVQCSLDSIDDCMKCFNTNCTCENNEKTSDFEFLGVSPYNIKREDEIKEKLIYKKNG